MNTHMVKHFLKEVIDIHKILDYCYLGGGVESSGTRDIKVTANILFLLLVDKYISICFNVIF